MMPTDRFERQLPALLEDLAEPRTPDYLDDLLWQTAHTSQRPAWTFLERWLPMADIATTARVHAAGAAGGRYRGPARRPRLLIAAIAVASRAPQPQAARRRSARRATA